MHKLLLNSELLILPCGLDAHSLTSSGKTERTERPTEIHLPHADLCSVMTCSSIENFLVAYRTLLFYGYIVWSQPNTSTDSSRPNACVVLRLFLLDRPLG